MLALRNDPEARRWFFNPEAVSPDDHARWFRETLTCQSRRLYLVVEESTGVPVGYVRFNLTQSGPAEVSLAIARDRRGRGYGTKALREACRLVRDSGVGARIVARILEDNVASLKTFRKAGFVATSTGLERNRRIVIVEAGG